MLAGVSDSGSAEAGVTVQRCLPGTPSDMRVELNWVCFPIRLFLSAVNYVFVGSCGGSLMPGSVWMCLLSQSLSTDPERVG